MLWTVASKERIITYPDKTLTVDIGEERVVEGMIRGELALIFAQEYVKSNLLAADRKVLILRTAVGGTGFERAVGPFCGIRAKAMSLRGILLKNMKTS